MSPSVYLRIRILPVFFRFVVLVDPTKTYNLAAGSFFLTALGVCVFLVSPHTAVHAGKFFPSAGVFLLPAFPSVCIRFPRFVDPLAESVVDRFGSIPHTSGSSSFVSVVSIGSRQLPG